MKRVIKTVIAAAITTVFASLALANGTAACNQRVGGSLTRGPKLSYSAKQGSTNSGSNSSSAGATSGTN